MNTSCYADTSTAKTCLACARQRAENLAVLGAKSVLELCVGPSLKTLEQCYSKHGISVTGNDIEARWEAFYPKGKWIIGDATKLDCSSFDAVVVAPPLSKGCSGRREDSLSLDQVVPSYYDFNNINSRIIVYVLPGRTLSVKEDRKQMHKFISSLNGKVEVVPLKNKVTKYVDLYCIRN
jgi:hypothetical protein